MRVSHKFSAEFDDDNLIATAGLVPVMLLAESAGLSGLVDEHVTVKGSAGANDTRRASSARGPVPTCYDRSACRSSQPRGPGAAQTEQSSSVRGPPKQRGAANRCSDWVRPHPGEGSAARLVDRLVRRLRGPL